MWRVLWAVLAVGIAPASAGERLALVIGNANYETAPLSALDNPINDAKLIAGKLETAGFSVTRVEDADLRRFKTSVRDFANALGEAPDGSLAVFYYAGHGLQGEGINYLIPIGATLERETDLEFEGVPAAWVFATLDDAHRGANVVLLDACRNDAFARSVGGGLAAPKAAPVGTFVSFATAPGMVAYDGLGDHSYYSASLADHLLTPGATIETVLKAVRRDVLAQTLGRQVPWDASSLIGDVVLVPQQADARVQSVVAKSAAKPTAPNEHDCDVHAAHPHGDHAHLAAAELGDVDVSAAQAACAEAMEAHPDEARFAFQLGRAFHADDKIHAAAELYRDAADHGHRNALVHLAELVDAHGPDVHHEPAHVVLARASDPRQSVGTPASLAAAKAALGELTEN